MKKKILSIILTFCLIACSGCAMPDAGASFAKHIAAREGEFWLLTSDVDATVKAAYAAHPEFQAAVSSVSSTAYPLWSKIEIKYDEVDLAQVHVAKTRDEVTEYLAADVAAGRATSISVLLGQTPADETEGMLEAVDAADPIGALGLESLGGTISTNDFTKDSVLLFDVKYIDSIDKITAAQQAITDAVETLSKSLWSADDSAYDRVRRIHDYLIDHVRYDVAGDSRLIDHTAYGALCHGKAVCDGYTEAARLLLNAAGIPNQVITGTADGSDHAWNAVQLNGAWYHMDITWDDPVSDDGRDHHEYEYFLVSDAKMREQHKWTAQITCPQKYK